MNATLAPASTAVATTPDVAVDARPVTASADATAPTSAAAQPFARLMARQPGGAEADTAAEAAAAGEVPATLDADTLLQSLASLIGGGADQSPVDDAATEPAAEASRADVATAPLLAMLMPTVLPTVMPPAAPALPVAAKVETSEDSQAQSAAASMPTAGDDSALLSGASTLVIDAKPVAANDPSAWAGLQRWSAELMAAMPSAGNAANAANAATADATPTLALPAESKAWQQPLLQALGDRLQLQISQRAEQATLHLSPPELGRVEIAIRQQGGALQVQFNATHDEVRQQLRQITEPLRQDLAQRHAGEVAVQVAGGSTGSASDGRGRDGFGGQAQQQSNQQGQPREGREERRQPGLALAEDGRAARFGDALSGLTSA